MAAGAFDSDLFLTREDAHDLRCHGLGLCDGAE